MSPRQREEPQLGLFNGTERPSVSPIPAATPSPEALEAARVLPSSIRMGTMSWTYPGWIGILFEKGVRQKDLPPRGLTAYGRHPLLRTVEVDRSYYQPVDEATYAGFAEQVPESFRFVAKAHKACTTGSTTEGSRFLDASYARDRVIEPFVRGVGGKAGPILFQFSPMRMAADRFATQLHDFLTRLPKGPLYAVELRSEALLTEAYGDALADAGAIHCFNAWGNMPGVGLQRRRLSKAVRGTLLARWVTAPGDSHEGAKSRFEPFDKIVEEDIATRADVATLVLESVRAGDPSFVIVSNKAEGCGPETAIRLALELGRPTTTTA